MCSTIKALCSKDPISDASETNKPGPIVSQPHHVVRSLQGVASALLPSALSWLCSPEASMAFQTAASQNDATWAHNFVTSIVVAVLTYWFLQSIFRQDASKIKPGEKKGVKSPSEDDDGVPHVHIRTVVDPYQQRESDWTSWRELENRVLAKSAAFEIATMLKESQPRVKSFLQSPSRFMQERPHLCDVDPVADIVYKHLKKLEESGKLAMKPGSDHLEGSELAQLQHQLMIAVAEYSALEQINHLVHLAHDTTSRPACLKPRDGVKP